MRKSNEWSRRVVFSAVLLSFATARTAGAGVITLDFNSLNDGNGTSAVQTYVRNVVGNALNLSAADQLLVKVKGGLAEENYIGDQHVTGPRRLLSNGEQNNEYPVNGTNGTVPRPMTLGSSEFGVMDPTYMWVPFALNNLDTYLVNKNANGVGEDRITMEFPFPIYGVSFDYEIFPDGTGDQPPDFSFAYNLVGVPLDAPVVTMTGVVQGVSPGDFGTYPYSPRSTANGDSKETAKQFIGQSGLLTFSPLPGASTTLEFIDWPQKIGIDNLQIYTSPVPEPGSLAIWCGTIAVGTVLCRRKRRKRAAGAAHSAAA
jgi:hypothetical protein